MSMKPETVPILTDALKEYYEASELVELCSLFDIEIEYGADELPYMRFAQRLINP